MALMSKTVSSLKDKTFFSTNCVSIIQNLLCDLYYSFLIIMSIKLRNIHKKYGKMLRNECEYKRRGCRINGMNRSPSSRQLKKYKIFLPVEIYLLAVFMQLASKFHVFPLALKFQDSFASVYCCSNLYNLRSFLREYLYQ